MDRPPLPSVHRRKPVVQATSCPIFSTGPIPTHPRPNWLRRHCRGAVKPWEIQTPKPSRTSDSKKEPGHPLWQPGFLGASCSIALNPPPLPGIRWRSLALLALPRVPAAHARPCIQARTLNQDAGHEEYASETQDIRQHFPGGISRGQFTSADEPENKQGNCQSGTEQHRGYGESSPGLISLQQTHDPLLLNSRHAQSRAFSVGLVSCRPPSECLAVWPVRGWKRGVSLGFGNSRPQLPHRLEIWLQDIWTKHLMARKKLVFACYWGTRPCRSLTLQFIPHCRRESP